MSWLNKSFWLNRVEDNKYHFLSNTSKKYAALVLKAGELSGFDVSVSDTAYSANGIRLIDYVAIYTREVKPHTPFWQALNELITREEHGLF